MSNQRKPLRANAYRSTFLRSRAWFARRNRWFIEEESLGGALSCAGCGREATKRELELHHLDYAGVVCEGGRWKALEPHSALVPLHPYCHDLLHRLIDRDQVLSRNRSRQAASEFALARLRAKLAPHGGRAA